jgi:hypothetical protein
MHCRLTIRQKLTFVPGLDKTGSKSDYARARRALAGACFLVLKTVFSAAEPLHNIRANFVRYRQILHGVHLVTFADKN